MLYRPHSALVPTLLWVCVGMFACGRDPILERAKDLEDAPGAGGAPPRGVPAEPQPAAIADPAPGKPDPPAAGAAAAPPPGAAASPPPGAAARPPPGKPTAVNAAAGVIDGPTVTLKGVVRLDDYELGSVRIDVFDGDQKQLEGPRPTVVAVAHLDRPGPFSVQIPASASQVWLGAYVDEDLNGRPGPQDPSGWYVGNPVDTSGGADGITIKLVRQPPPARDGL